MGKLKFLYDYCIVFMILNICRFLAFDKFKTSCSLKIKARPVLLVLRRKGRMGPCPCIPLRLPPPLNFLAKVLDGHGFTTVSFDFVLV